MKYLLYTSVLIFAETNLSESAVCKGQTFQVLYKEELKTGLLNPREFTANSEYLYFSHGKEGRLAKINLDNKQFANIGNIRSRTQSTDNDTLYVATNRGIFKLKPKTKYVRHIGAKNAIVGTVYYKDALYFVDKASHTAYTLKDGKKSKLDKLANEKVERFVIDNNGTVLFVGEELKSLNVNGITVSYKGSDNLEFRGLAADKEGDIYACTKYGVLKVNKENRTLDNVLNHDTTKCTGVAIDSGNNILYSNEKSVFRIKKETKCVEFDD